MSAPTTAVAAASDDLETLAGAEPRVITTRRGEAIEIREFFFGQWPRAVRLIRPVTTAVEATGIAGFVAGTFRLAENWPLLLPQLLDEGGEAVIEFVAFAIGKPRAWFDTLGGDDGLALTRAVFEVNGDFFVQRIAPMLGLQVQAAAAGTAAAAADGAPSSPSSSPAGIDGTTSTG